MIRKLPIQLYKVWLVFPNHCTCAICTCTALTAGNAILEASLTRWMIWPVVGEIVRDHHDDGVKSDRSGLFRRMSDIGHADSGGIKLGVLILHHLYKCSSFFTTRPLCGAEMPVWALSGGTRRHCCQSDSCSDLDLAHHGLLL
ncbi:hypothetical protein BDR03DRAFT_719719 [Suillus americanus]|nr:hypothetical protein BDR03DRAFT_719719 [Suillus americanus]